MHGMESVLTKPDYDRILNSAENLSKIRDTQPSTPIKGRVRIRSPVREEGPAGKEGCCLVYEPPKQSRGSTKAVSLTSDSKVSLHSSLISTVLPTSHSLQSASMAEADMTPARRTKLAELENATISRQRGELQLLLGELRERDRELNAMVQTHTKQLAAWERDRNTIRGLEERCQTLQGDICSKNDDIRALTSRLRLADSEDLNKETALSNSQQQLATVTERHSHMQMEIEDLQEKNRALTRTIMELNTTIGQFDAREQELITVLKLKDKDLSESCSRISGLTSRLQKQETVLETSRRAEGELRRAASDWKNKYDAMWKEHDHCKRVLRASDQKNGEQAAELQRFKQEVPTLRKEHILASEREKRRAAMLELEQSRGARLETELSNLRDLCERQQRDLAVLEQNLHNTRDIVNTQQQRIMIHRQVDATVGKSSSQQTKPTLSSSYNPRSRSPSSRSPSRANTHSPTRYSTPADRVQSRAGQVSPSHYRSRSPEVGGERYGGRSPVHTREQRAASPDSRYYPSSYSASLPSPPRHQQEDTSYRGRLPQMDSSGYYTQLYSSKYHLQAHDKPQEVPYKSYSLERPTSDTYKSPGWSTTKALAHATDEIINKYYPVRGDVSLHGPSQRGQQEVSLPEPSQRGQQDVGLPEPPQRSESDDSRPASEASTPRPGEGGKSCDQGLSHASEDRYSRESQRLDIFPHQGRESSTQDKGMTNQSSHSLPVRGSEGQTYGSVTGTEGNQEARPQDGWGDQLVTKQSEADSQHLSEAESHHSLHSLHTDSAMDSVHSQHSAMDSVHSQHSDRESLHSQRSAMDSVHSQHSARESVHSKYSAMDSMHSQHSARESLHSQHSAVDSVHSQHSAMDSMHSQHSNVESVPSHHSARDSVHSVASSGVSHHTDAGSVHSGQRREPGSRGGGGDEAGDSPRSSGFGSIYGSEHLNGAPRPGGEEDLGGSERQQLLARAAALRVGEGGSGASTPRSERSQRSEVRSVHSTGPTHSQVVGDQDVDDLFACTKSAPAKISLLSNQHTDQTLTGDEDLEDILAESREVAQQLERSSETPSSHTAQNGHVEFYEELQE